MSLGFETFDDDPTEGTYAVRRLPNHIEDRWVERVKTIKNQPQAETALHLSSADAESPVEILRKLECIPIQGESTIRIGEEALRRVLSLGSYCLHGTMTDWSRWSPDTASAAVANVLTHCCAPLGSSARWFAEFKTDTTRLLKKE